MASSAVLASLHRRAGMLALVLILSLAAAAFPRPGELRFRAEPGMFAPVAGSNSAILEKRPLLAFSAKPKENGPRTLWPAEHDRNDAIAVVPGGPAQHPPLSSPRPAAGETASWRTAHLLPHPTGPPHIG